MDTVNEEILAEAIEAVAKPVVVEVVAEEGEADDLMPNLRIYTAKAMDIEATESGSLRHGFVEKVLIMVALCKC